MSGQYVGIDLHRRRSVIVHKNEAGEVVSVRRIDNDPAELAAGDDRERPDRIAGPEGEGADGAARLHVPKKTLH